MPELPEVETVRAGLSQLLPGKTIARVTYDWDKSYPNAQADSDAYVIGAKVADIRRRAKVLIIDLSSEYSLVIHLKMTGQLVYVRKLESLVTSQKSPVKVHHRLLDVKDYAPEERFGAGHPSDSLVGKLPDKSTRVTFEFKDGGQLFFNDQRKFGWVKLVEKSEIRKSKVHANGRA